MTPRAIARRVIALHRRLNALARERERHALALTATDTETRLVREMLRELEGTLERAA